MTRDVLARKLARLETLLADLRPHAGKSLEEMLEDHYEIERIIELLVQVAVDMIGHDLAERGAVPESYRDTFIQAGDRGILPERLAGKLADAAGLKNVLAHVYEEIDYDILAASIDDALADFKEVAELYALRLSEPADGIFSQ